MSEPIVRVRLDARHGIPPMSLRDLLAFCRENAVGADAVRAAEKEGLALRNAGQRCLCPYCEANSNTIGGKERLRQHYVARRHAQLQAEGIDSYESREQTIQQEINAGAAFQAGPVQVTRTGALQ